MRLDGGREDQELAEETGGERKARQREEEECQRRGHVRPPAPQAAQVVVAVEVLALAAHHRDHREGAEVGERVGGEVVEGALDTERDADADRHADQDVAGLGDARVGEHPLDAVLRQGGEVADDHGEDGDRDHHRAPAAVVGGEGVVEEADDDDERRHLGGDAHEGGHRGRRSLVDVGRPGVEGRRADLEGEADEHEDDPADQQRVDRQRAAHRLGDLRELGVPGLAVHQRHPEEEERGGEGAEQQVLDRRLLGALLLAGESAQDVERDREQLDGEEDDHEAGGAGQQHHPHRGRHQQ